MSPNAILMAIILVTVIGVFGAVILVQLPTGKRRLDKKRA